MAKYGGNQNYSSYRGRTPKWKSVLAVVLILIILLSGTVLWLQRYLVYNGSGHLRLENPWQESEEEKLPPPEVTIQEPELEPEPATRRLFLPGPASALTSETLSALSAAETEKRVDGGAVLVRKGGKVYFPTANALPEALSHDETSDSALKELLSRQKRTTAFFGCFGDSIAAGADVEGMGLKNTGKHLFYDGENRNWLDAGKEKARDYLCKQLTDCAALGVDEIVLMEVSYPTVGKLSKIAYPESGPAKALNSFLGQARKTLDEAGYADVRLSVELPAETILAGVDEKAGVEVGSIAALTDGVYCRCAAADIPALEEAVESRGGKRFVPILEAPDPALADRAEYVLLSLD